MGARDPGYVVLRLRLESAISLANGCAHYPGKLKHVLSLLRASRNDASLYPVCSMSR